MIRVDGSDQINSTRGDGQRWVGDFGNDDFEGIMSTHYGRIVVLEPVHRCWNVGSCQQGLLRLTAQTTVD